MQVSFFLCNFAAQNESCPCGKESFAVFSSRRGYMSFGMGVNTGHIEKRRLTRFVLAIRNLVNSSICQNIAAKDAHWYVNNVRIYCAHLYIRRGLQCCLFYRLGNTRASNSGTARLQSRFYLYKRNTFKDPLFCMYIPSR